MVSHLVKFLFLFLIKEVMEYKQSEIMIDRLRKYKISLDRGIWRPPFQGGLWPWKQVFLRNSRNINCPVRSCLLRSNKGCESFGKYGQKVVTNAKGYTDNWVGSGVGFMFPGTYSWESWEKVPSQDMGTLVYWQWGSRTESWWKLWALPQGSDVYLLIRACTAYHRNHCSVMFPEWLYVFHSQLDME